MEPYEDCDRCKERFVGAEAIRKCLRWFTTLRGKPDRLCLDCYAEAVQARNGDSYGNQSRHTKGEGTDSNT